ncbi:MAG: NAD(P)H-quinone oxidoreductase subunit L [Elainellaceae cyanobacterium]
MEFLQNNLLVLLMYAGLGGAYLLVLPAATMLYLKARWYDASSVERVAMYFCVFFFFPGLLLLSPFVNLRPERRAS